MAINIYRTAHGPMPFGIWCELERLRIIQAGHVAGIVTRADRRMALFRRAPAALGQRETQGYVILIESHAPSPRFYRTVLPEGP